MSFMFSPTVWRCCIPAAAAAAECDKTLRSLLVEVRKQGGRAGQCYGIYISPIYAQQASILHAVMQARTHTHPHTHLHIKYIIQV